MRPLENSKLYRFPWSKNDNPIGWLEVTDYCNIHCKGCYRQNLEGHFPLDRLKEEILMMKEFRNIDNVSLAGGEPLCHPEIEELIAFISFHGIKPYLLTNGEEATEYRMRRLKRLGLAGVAFHVDSMQGRRGWEGKDEIGLIPLRDEYVELMASVGGIPTSFGITVYKDNFERIPDLIRWGIKNIKYVQGQNFIPYRGALTKPGVTYSVRGRVVEMGVDTLGYSGEEEVSEYAITSEDIYNIIKESFPEYEASAYLGGTERHDSFKWLVGFMVGSDGGWYGAVGPKTVEFAQTFRHFTKGTYSAYARSPKVGRKIFLAAVFDPYVRRLTRRFLSNPLRFFYKPIYGQSIGITQPPDVLADGRVDMCDSCPDITVYKGQFVHSCRMDEYRRFGGLIIRIHDDGAEAKEDTKSVRK